MDMALSDLPNNASLAEEYDLTELQGRFLEEFIQTGNIVKAAEAAGCTPRAHYNALTRNARYRKVYESIRKVLAERIIENMVDRALNGDLLIHGGQIVKDDDGKPLKKYDTILQIYLSKALAGLSDQTGTQKQASSSGPSIHIHMPEQGNGPPIIEVNEAEE